jgi:hypothetical protein
MAFDITGLGTYIQNGQGYAIKSIAEAPTAKLLIETGNVQYGVKGTAAILKINSDIVFADASTCARTVSGSIALSNKNLVVKPIASYENMCPKVLWNTFYNESVRQGQLPEEAFLPVFADTIMNERALKIAQENEKMIWRGVYSATGVTNLSRMDGIVTQVSGTTTAATGTTMVNKLQNFFLACDSVVRNQPDFIIAIPLVIWNEYLVALANQNIYRATDDFKLFGTTATLHPTVGLDATRTVVGMRLSNLQLGMDGQSDADTAQMRYSVETTNWYVDFVFGLGIAVVFGDSAEALKQVTVAA